MITPCHCVKAAILVHLVPAQACCWRQRCRCGGAWELLANPKVRPASRHTQLVALPYSHQQVGALLLAAGISGHSQPSLLVVLPRPRSCVQLIGSAAGGTCQLVRLAAGSPVHGNQRAAAGLWLP